jgi:hypothetical protein
MKLLGIFRGGERLTRRRHRPYPGLPIQILHFDSLDVDFPRLLSIEVMTVHLVHEFRSVNCFERSEGKVVKGVRGVTQGQSHPAYTTEELHHIHQIRSDQMNQRKE